MNIGFLEEIYDNLDHEYYIVEMWDKPHLVRRPTSILRALQSNQYKTLNELHLSVVRKLNNTPIDCNICLTDNYPPFQLGMTVGSITRFQVINCGISEFLKRTSKDHDFNDYYTVIRELNKENNPK